MRLELRAALAYAARGWAVFPAWWANPDGSCACADRACSSPGKHPVAVLARRGVLDATVDERLLARWWGKVPRSNVAVATGPVSGLLVLDVDDRHGGDESLDRLLARYGQLPPTPVVLTGGGGRQYYFRHPAGVTVRSSAGKLGPGLDVRAAGGYVIAPPSLHRSQRRYTWDVTAHYEDLPLAQPPDWLIRLLTQPTQQPKPTELTRIPIGQRNVTLTRLAGAMRRYGLDADAIAAALLVTNLTKCDPPLDEEEVIRIAKSVSRYAPQAPVFGNGHSPHSAQLLTESVENTRG